MKKFISLMLCAALLIMPNVSAATYYGVDIYHGTSSNGQVNWASLSQQKNFVYIKSSEGEHSADSMFADNIRGAKSAGMKWGAYHFLRMYSSKSAKKQADYFYGRIKYAGYSIIPCVDCESHDGQKTAAGIRACIRSFIDEFYKLSGMKPVIYSGTDYANTILRGQFSDCKLWQADYRGYAGMAAGWKAYSAWQYSENGNIPAIANREVDLDMSGGGIFMQSAAKQQTAKSVKSVGVYAVMTKPHGYNAMVSQSVELLTNGGSKTKYTVTKCAPVDIESISDNTQLLEIVYKSGTHFRHGYIRKDHVIYKYLNKWHNGSTRETVYTERGLKKGALFRYEKATPLFAASNGYIVIYTAYTGKVRTGIVNYKDKFRFT